MERAVRGQLLNVAQVAEKLNVSKHSVYKLIKNNTINWFPVMPGKFQIDSADIDDWLASIKIPAGESLSEHLQDMDLWAEDELVKALKALVKKGKLNFLLKTKEAV